MDASAQETQQDLQPAPLAHLDSSDYNATIDRGPESTVGGRPRLASTDSIDYFGFLHHKDDDIYVFDEPPEVHVLRGRCEESWPTRYVEYDVEVRTTGWHSSGRLPFYRRVSVACNLVAA